MAFQESERGADGDVEEAIPAQGLCVRVDEFGAGEQIDFRKIDTEGKMIKNVAYYNSKIDTIAQEVAEEAARACVLFAPMNSPHEAMAVILEEYTEYQLEVFKHNTSKPGRDTRPRQREELIQLAAMCMRAILDTIDKPDFYEDYAARARKEYDLTKGAK